ncbi:MAG: hypothetical protein M0Q94_09000 [Candidatus Cloacimonetes bacterium]|nr:hypothetical protein [Candidatus Cloacimonadota bacterium]
MLDTTKISLEKIDYFIATSNNADIFFNNVISVALSHKFGNLNKQITLTGKEITKAIFKLTASDKLMFKGKPINGQRISELFILSIYLKYLSQQFPQKTLFISAPLKEEYFDLAVLIGEFSVDNIKEKKYHAPDSTLQFYFQIKECFDYKNSGENGTVLKTFNKEELSKAINKYPDKNSMLFLFYSRNFSAFNTSESDNFLLENPNVAYIGNLGAIIQKNSMIKVSDAKFNFFILKGNKKITISFNVPPYIIFKE